MTRSLPEQTIGNPMDKNEILPLLPLVSSDEMPLVSSDEMPQFSEEHRIKLREIRKTNQMRINAANDAARRERRDSEVAIAMWEFNIKLHQINDKYDDPQWSQG